MNLILILGWIVDEWYFNTIIHSILQNVIQVLTWHPWSSFADAHNHHVRKIHATTS
jgi:hypothetical protein